MPAGPACGYDRHLVRRPVRCRDVRGDWLSRLERAVHIREVTGSNPVSHTTVTSIEAGSARTIPRLSASSLASTPRSVVAAVSDEGWAAPLMVESPIPRTVPRKLRAIALTNGPVELRSMGAG